MQLQLPHDRRLMEDTLYIRTMMKYRLKKTQSNKSRKLKYNQYIQLLN